MSIGPLLRDWRTAPPPQPARPRARGRRLDPPPELRGDRPVAARAREMVLHLAEQLEVPLRERNRLLLAAGYAPRYARARARRARDAPGRATPSTWCCRPRALPGARGRPRLGARRRQRRGIAMLLAGVPEHLLAPPVNVLRAEPAPATGLAPRIAQPRRVARAPARAPAPPGRADRRPGAARRCSTSSPATRRDDPGRELGTRNDVVVPLRLRDRRGRADVLLAR